MCVYLLARSLERALSRDVFFRIWITNLGAVVDSSTIRGVPASRVIHKIVRCRETNLNDRMCNSVTYKFLYVVSVYSFESENSVLVLVPVSIKTHLRTAVGSSNNCIIIIAPSNEVPIRQLIAKVASNNYWIFSHLGINLFCRNVIDPGRTFSVSRK